MRSGNHAMTVEVTHPEPSLLVDYSMGRLGFADRAGIESHLESCQTCCAVLSNQADSRDTLLELARRASTTPVSNPSLASIANIPPELLDHPRYRIIAPLGEGGMGIVFKAEHKLMGRIVALKLISKRLTANEQAVDRFRREVRAAAQLGHANIVTAYEAEEVKGLLILVMEYVEGISLDRFVARQKSPVPVAMACHFIRQAALGLQHAHRKGMVHRDIKPQNLMLTRKGIIKILDFGLARFGEDLGPDDGLSTPNLVVGTPDYLAPEQARNSHDVDIRADIYALGCTLYFLLTRRVPFPGGSAFEKMIAHTEATPEALQKLRPDVSKDVCAIVEKMMAKEKEARFQTPVDLASALAPFAKLGNTTATDLTPIQPVFDPVFLDEGPVDASGETEIIADAPTGRTRSRSRTNSEQPRKRWLVPVLAVSLLLSGSLIVYLSTRGKGEAANNTSKGTESAVNTDPKGGPQPRFPNDFKGASKGDGTPGPFGLKKDGRSGMAPPIRSVDAKYRVLIVVPKFGLWFKDLEPVRRTLWSKGVYVAIASTEWGQVQFYNGDPAAKIAVVEPDHALSSNFDYRGFDAILCVGANVNEFNPEWTAKKNWQKEGKNDPARYLGNILSEMNRTGRVIGSICTGQAVLYWHGIITSQKVATINNDVIGYNLLERYPNAKWQGRQQVVSDGNLITASGPEQGVLFGEEVFRAMQARRP